MERERECQNSVRERQRCSGDVGFVTWRSSSYTDICLYIVILPLQEQSFNRMRTPNAFSNCSQILKSTNREKKKRQKNRSIIYRLKKRKGVIKTKLLEFFRTILKQLFLQIIK